MAEVTFRRRRGVSPAKMYGITLSFGRRPGFSVRLIRRSVYNWGFRTAKAGDGFLDALPTEPMLDAGRWQPCHLAKNNSPLGSVVNGLLDTFRR